MEPYTVADLFDLLTVAGVTLTLADHGSLRITGARLPDALRPYVVEAKETLVEIVKLENRLHAGWRKCEAEIRPRERERLEAFWLKLLAEYERAMDGPLLGHELGKAA